MTLNFLQTCEKHPSFPGRDAWQDITDWTVYPVEDMLFDPEMESFRHSAYNYFEDILLEKASHRGKFFIDQNGLTVQDGAMYGTDEQGDLYDLEPLCSFRPSEY